MERILVNCQQENCQSQVGWWWQNHNWQSFSSLEKELLIKNNFNYDIQANINFQTDDFDNFLVNFLSYEIRRYSPWGELIESGELNQILNQEINLPIIKKQDEQVFYLLINSPLELSLECQLKNFNFDILLNLEKQQLSEQIDNETKDDQSKKEQSQPIIISSNKNIDQSNEEKDELNLLAVKEENKNLNQLFENKPIDESLKIDSVNSQEELVLNEEIRFDQAQDFQKKFSGDETKKEQNSFFPNFFNFQFTPFKILPILISLIFGLLILIKFSKISYLRLKKIYKLRHLRRFNKRLK